MPAKSRAQQKLIYARFGKAYAKRHHFDNKGPLPDHVDRVAKHKMRNKRGS